MLAYVIIIHVNLVSIFSTFDILMRAFYFYGVRLLLFYQEILEYFQNDLNVIVVVTFGASFESVVHNHLQMELIFLLLQII
jgi:hypothetical protein